MGIARVLGNASLRVHALPPSAILCVRRCADPKPRGLNPRICNGASSDEWFRALENTLNATARRAVRAALEPVGAAAEAVWFADEAELLAALAIAWLDKTWRECWWWRSLFQWTEFGSLMALEWERRPHAIAGALRVLRATERLVPFIVAADDTCAARLYVAAASVHGWRIPDNVMADTSIPVRQSTSGHYPAPHAMKDQIAAMCIAKRCLLAVGFGERFPDRLVELRTELQTKHEAPKTRQVEVIADGEQKAGEVQVRDLLRREEMKQAISNAVPISGTSMNSSPATEQFVDMNSHRLPALRAEAVLADEESGFLTILESPAVPQAEYATAATDGSGVSKTEMTLRSDELLSLIAPRITRVREQTRHDAPKRKVDARVSDQAVPTRFGGAFFLLNLCLFLELYGDFTSPVRRGLALDVWDFLALLTRWIAGTSVEEDELWPFLARLAGREQSEQPGQTFNPDTDWTLASGWLPEGASAPTDLTLDAWQQWLFPLLLSRLEKALGVSGAAEVAKLLILHTAKITVTPVHLHITYSLDTHPVEIRLAGLDHDPGWIPAGERYVAFHFE